MFFFKGFYVIFLPFFVDSSVLPILLCGCTKIRFLLKKDRKVMNEKWFKEVRSKVSTPVIMKSLSWSPVESKSYYELPWIMKNSGLPERPKWYNHCQVFSDITKKTTNSTEIIIISYRFPAFYSVLNVIFSRKSMNIYDDVLQW